ncbi:MAG: hypothetical protein E6J89_01465 [Deltaproteobacteria bacterium]|nr:MAG: hypothetical protein E6J89_01465 [Deltaproteobacteria bacterium]
MNRRVVLLVALGLALVLIVPAVTFACSVCLGGADGYDPLTDAFNWSVLFLMAMPYAVVGSIAGWIFYSYRSAVKKRGLLKKKAPALRLAWNHKESGR